MAVGGIGAEAGTTGADVGGGGGVGLGAGVTVAGTAVAVGGMGVGVGVAGTVGVAVGKGVMVGGLAVAVKVGRDVERTTTAGFGCIMVVYFATPTRPTARIRANRHPNGASIKTGRSRLRCSFIASVNSSFYRPGRNCLHRAGFDFAEMKSALTGVAININKINKGIKLQKAQKMRLHHSIWGAVKPP